MITFQFGAHWSNVVVVVVAIKNEYSLKLQCLFDSRIAFEFSHIENNLMQKNAEKKKIETDSHRER